MHVVVHFLLCTVEYTVKLPENNFGSENWNQNDIFVIAQLRPYYLFYCLENHFQMNRQIEKTL